MLYFYLHLYDSLAHLASFSRCSATPSADPLSVVGLIKGSTVFILDEVFISSVFHFQRQLPVDNIHIYMQLKKMFCLTV